MSIGISGFGVPLRTTLPAMSAPETNWSEPAKLTTVRNAIFIGYEGYFVRIKFLRAESLHRFCADVASHRQRCQLRTRFSFAFRGEDVWVAMSQVIFDFINAFLL